MSKKTNPGRIPCSKRDVEVARQEGHNEGMKFMISLVLLILKDKHDWPDEGIDTLAAQVDLYCKSINDGSIKIKDVMDALKADYDLAVRV